MAMSDESFPQSCRHGTAATIEYETYDPGLRSTFQQVAWGRWSFYYTCETPSECKWAEVDRLRITPACDGS